MSTQDFKSGYGLVYCSVMRDKSLTPEAKAIYAYLCAFAGAGETCYPSTGLMQSELKMSKDRFYRHIVYLERAGIVTKERTKNGNRWGPILYKLNHSPGK